MDQTLLITGDIFIPSRSAAVPPQLLAKLDPSLFTGVICTGNLTSPQTKAFLQTISSNLLLVKGPLDDIPALSEDFRDFTGLKICALNGAEIVPRGNVQQICKTAVSLDCRVVCVGGELGVERFGDLVIVKSGSLTGIGQTPGFAVLRLIKGKVTVYLYRLKQKIEIETIEVGQLISQQSSRESGEEQHCEDSGEGRTKEQEDENAIEKSYENDFQFDA